MLVRIGQGIVVEEHFLHFGHFAQDVSHFLGDLGR